MKTNNIQNLVIKTFKNKSLKEQANKYFDSVMNRDPLDEQELVLNNVRVLFFNEVKKSEDQLDWNDKNALAECIDQLKDKTNELFELKKHVNHCYADIQIMTNEYPDESEHYYPIWQLILLWITIVGGIVWLINVKKHKQEVERIKNNKLVNVSLNIQNHLAKIEIIIHYLHRIFNIDNKTFNQKLSRQVDHVNEILKQHKLKDIKVSLPQD